MRCTRQFCFTNAIACVVQPAAENTGNYRAMGDAAGPTSSHAEYTSTLDPGKFQ